MKTSRTLRLFTALVAILSMLFMQHAAASYLCPGAALGGNIRADSMRAEMSAMPAMADCTGMDTDQSTLCHVYSHGEAARQSLDKLPVADLPPFVALVLPLALAIFDVPTLQEVKPPLSVALTRSTAPPIAIRHCCFRI